MGMAVDRPWTAADFFFTLAMWAVMMVGMMAGSAAPVLLLFAATRRGRNQQGVPASVLCFGLGYLTIWPVGIPAVMRPTGSRNVLDKLSNAILHDVSERTSLPPGFVPSALAEIVVVSDFWSPIAQVRATLAQLSATGAHGHTVQIVDPAEETFPYSGRVEFIEPEGAGSITAGRAEAWKSDYETRVARHRAEIRAETDKLGWSFTIHRTDRPATELLLALHARLGAPPPGAVVSGRLRIAGQIGSRA